MKPLAIIPARSGSTRAPNKNFRDFCGKPLLAWSVEACRGAGCNVVISVDTEEGYTQAVSIAHVNDIVQLRPPHLRGDGPLEPVIEHVLKTVGKYAHRVVLKQPTSPLITSGSVKRLVQESFGHPTMTAVVSNPLAYFRWYHGHRLYRDRPKTQDISVCLEGPGLWVFTRKHFFSSFGNRCNGRACLVLPREEGIDIDDELDWVVAEAVMKAKMEGQI